MDEYETRIAAVEYLIEALLPWMEQQAIEDAASTLRAALRSAEGEEGLALVQAIRLLTDGREKFRPPAVGHWLRHGDSRPPGS
jgi:hypothetical protein